MIVINALKLSLNSNNPSIKLIRNNILNIGEVKSKKLLFESLVASVVSIFNH